MDLRRTILAGVLSLTLVERASGCPLCDSPTGRDVRAGIADQSFARNVAAVLAPFPILLAVVAAVHFGPLTSRSRRDQEAGDAHAR